MPLPVIALAIPVIHSSGAWIAYGAGAYLSGTLSSTWIGAFVLGNIGILKTLGLVSTASAVGALVSCGSSIALGISASIAGLGSLLGAILVNVGLGKLAVWLGLVPATFLGLTLAGWSYVGIGVLILGFVGAVIFWIRSKMKPINEERQKGGLEKISFVGLIREIRNFERSSIREICHQLAQKRSDCQFNQETETLILQGDKYAIKNISYDIDSTHQEYLVLKSKRLKKRKIEISLYFNVD